MGYKSRRYKKEHCEKVIEHMSQGLSLESFGAVVNMSRAGIAKWQTMFPEFGEAVAVGKARALAFWEKLLVSCALGIIPPEIKSRGSKGINVAAVIFCLKTRFHEQYGEAIKHSFGQEDLSFTCDPVDEQDKI